MSASVIGIRESELHTSCTLPYTPHKRRPMHTSLPWPRHSERPIVEWPCFDKKVPVFVDERPFTPPYHDRREGGQRCSHLHSHLFPHPFTPAPIHTSIHSCSHLLHTCSHLHAHLLHPTTGGKGVHRAAATPVRVPVHARRLPGVHCSLLQCVFVYSTVLLCNLFFCIVLQRAAGRPC